MSKFSGILGGRRRRIGATVAAAVLVLGGGTAIIVGVTEQDAAPAATAMGSTGARSTDNAPTAPSSTTSSAEAGPSSTPRTATMAPATPVAISIPAIDVQSPVFTVGQNPDGTIHVPQPGPNYDKAAWYKGSPTPGERGPAVILGHIDSAENGPSVFFNLDAMRPGQKVSVTRADGTVAVFTVDKVERYDKDYFPTLQVYGNTDGAELRLITCGGTFNDSTGNYEDNIVVYAHLTGSHPAEG